MKYFKAGILIVTSLIAIWVITLISGFTYLNQSSMTPIDQQLNFFNYLLPSLLTIIFICYFTFSKVVKLNHKRNWVLILLIGLGALIVIPWQLEQLKFLFQKKGFNFTIEIFAYLIGLTFTVWTLIGEVKRKKYEKIKSDWNEFIKQTE